MYALTAIIGFPMGYVLIMSFGVLGLIASTLASGLLTLIIALSWTKKHYGLTVDWLSSARILLSSSIAAVPSYMLVSALPFSNWVRLIIGIVFFVAVFVVAALLMRAVTRSDINNLRGMVSGLGALSGLITRLLNVTEKILEMLKL